MEDRTSIYNVRIDPEIYNQVTPLATADDRSITKMINLLIKRGIEYTRVETARAQAEGKQ
jgi:hypothetical protein